MTYCLFLLALWAPRTASAAPGAPAASGPVVVSSSTLECGPKLPDALAEARLGGRLWSGIADAERCGGDQAGAPADRAAALDAAGRLRLLVGDAPGARADLEKALELAPEDPETLARLASAARERPDEALRFARRAAAAQPLPARKAAVERLAAEIALDMGDAGLARSLGESALKTDEDDIDTLAILARSSRADPKAAARYASRAVKAAARAPLWYRGAALRASAQAWLDIDEPAKALAPLEAAISLDPHDLDALDLLVQAAPRDKLPIVTASSPRKSGAPRELSRKAAEARLARDPGDLEALRSLAESARKAGSLDDAKAFAGRLALAVADAPAWRQIPAYRMAVEELNAAGDSDKALNCMLRALELDWRAPESLRMFHDLYDGRDATRLAAARINEGVARARLGDGEGAARSFNEALAFVPDYRDAYERLAQLQFDERKPKEALATVEKMLARSGDDASALERGCRLKARVELALGDEAAAVAALSRVLPQDRARDLAADFKRAAELKSPAPATAEGVSKPAEKEAPTAAGAAPRGDVIEQDLREGRGKDALALANGLVDDSAKLPAPERVAALRRRARVRLALSDSSGAAKDFKKALELDPGDPETVSAWLDAAKAKAPAARAFVDGHEPSEPARRPAWLVLRGWTRFMNADAAGADGDFKAALALDADKACHNGLFPAHRERLSPTYLELCAAAFPAEARLSMDAGVARYVLGQFDAAAADFEKAVALKPGWEEAAQSLAAARAAKR